MARKRSLTFKLVTTADFNAFFDLDSPGYFVARDAVRAGEATEAIDVLEVLVLANKLYEAECRDRLAEALEPFGKAQEYLAFVETDEASNLVIHTLGKRKVEQILRDAAQYVRRESRVGTGENDQAGNASR